jgi:hypothetical protein
LKIPKGKSEAVNRRKTEEFEDTKKLMSFFYLQLLITLLVSSNSSVFLLFTASDYPFGIFKLFGLSSI